MNSGNIFRSLPLLLMGLSGNAVAAESETVTMRLFRTYCVATEAVPAAVIAAAEKDGWKLAGMQETRGSQTLTKEVEGIRLFLVAASDPNPAVKGVNDHSCLINGSEAPEPVMVEITRFAGVKPTPAPGALDITFIYVERPDGKHEQISVGRLEKPAGLSKAEIEALRVVGVGGAGSGVSAIYMRMSAQ